MIRDSLINKLQGVQILQKFLQFKCDLDKLSAFFQQKNRTKQQLKKFIKNKFRELILEIQSELFRANKIQKLKLFDHASDQMFEELAQMDKYFPQRLFGNFLIEQKTKHQRIQKSTTSAKLQIYSHVLRYAQQENLFKYVFTSFQDNLKNKGPCQTPSKIYELEQLQIIYHLYKRFEGNLSKIQEKLSSLDYKQEKFTSYQLQRNVKNLQLIGLYRIFFIELKSKNGKGMLWQKFVRDYQIHYQKIEECNTSVRGILMRMAIRNQVKPHQIRIVCRKMGRKFQEKPLVKLTQPPPLKRQQKQCKTDEVERLREKLKEVLNAKVNYIKEQQ